MKGIGVDTIEIERIAANIEKYGESFLDKILTENEKNYCLGFSLSAPIVAGRFAAKEAIVKALGTGFGECIEFKDIEILNNPQGKPEVQLSERANSRFDSPNILLSISHSKTDAVAFAVWL